jgi:ABC-type uncharacterized transport system substrate-binding protein
MRRRQFVTLIAGMAVWRSRLARTKPLVIALLMFATALSAAGSQASEKRLGILMPFQATDPEIQTRVAAFREELRKLGWTDDNIRIDERWASDKMEQVRVNAAELLAWKPDVLLITGGRTVAAVREYSHRVKPVKLPPGRAKLSATPFVTGSAPPAKTTGTECV